MARSFSEAEPLQKSEEIISYREPVMTLFFDIWEIWCVSYTCLAENENIAEFRDRDNMKTKMSDYRKNDMKS